ncbi:GIN domain-containing protein [Aquimarina brevivitae]|uniref:Putative autotransporter adhesin-like protein n=1 Tax=Aquimarina brevivitae TaxID=323412 RepID=A0A4Q7P3Q9_9FLAO|nr:DUF2807 domain-containing protein [Aquimarina brevivitae]RZS93312.1 putative autotransporter adhesin-like protein [Aquimarina brevivitae]
MKFKLSIVFIVLISATLLAQKEKVKGNKIVMTEQKIIDNFSSIEVYDNLQVTLMEDSDPMITIEADSNVQEFIVYEVVNDVLTIKTKADIRRAKALNITIRCAAALQSLKFYNEVQANAKNSLIASNILIECHNETEVFLTVEAQQLKATAHEKANVTLHTTASEAFYQINQEAVFKGVVTSDSLTVDLYQNAEAELEGEVKNLLVRAGLDSEFFGQKLISGTSKLIAEGKSECYIKSNDAITIEAIDEAEIYLLGEPKIKLDVFLNEATLYKKNLDYTPNRFILN